MSAWLRALACMGCLWCGCAAALGDDCAVGRKAPAAAATSGPAELGILILTGKAVRPLGADGDLAPASQAGYSPDGRHLLYATSGRKKELVLLSLGPDSKERRVLPLPSIETEQNMAWQWSFSADGRWLFVSRRAAPWMWFRDARPETLGLDWAGFVDLKSNKPVPLLRRVRSCLGWQGGRCLILMEPGWKVIAVDPERPEQQTELLAGVSTFVCVAPDGRHAVTFDGREGNSTLTLRPLPGGPGKVLLDERLEEHEGRYALAVRHGGAFSPSSRWVALGTSVWRQKQWQAAMKVHSADGSRMVYVDAFLARDKTGAPRPVWSPRSDRFCYWRGRQGRDDWELVLVTLREDKPEARVLHAAKDGLVRLPSFPLLWSPEGDRLAWLSGTHHAKLCDVSSGRVTGLGRLSGRSLGWTWASTEAVGPAVCVGPGNVSLRDLGEEGSVPGPTPAKPPATAPADVNMGNMGTLPMFSWQ